MKTKNIIYLLATLVGVLLMVIVYQSLSQPGINDLVGEYTEIAVYRNENNTGPVVRIFAVYTKDELWDDMRAYGDFMPHTKYGNTKVFFLKSPLKACNFLLRHLIFQCVLMKLVWLSMKNQQWVGPVLKNIPLKISKV